jgi:hypothetical protein
VPSVRRAADAVVRADLADRADCLSFNLRTKARGPVGPRFRLECQDGASGNLSELVLRPRWAVSGRAPAGLAEAPSGYFGRTEWNIDLAAERTSSATEGRFAGVSFGAASARRSNGGRGSGMSAGGVGRLESSVRAGG